MKTSTNIFLGLLLCLFFSGQQLHAQIKITDTKIGINRANPNVAIDALGLNPDDAALLNLANSDETHQLLFFPGRLNDPNPFIQWTDGDPLRFATTQGGFTEWMRIQPDGKVGIGTDFPLELLDVDGNVKAIKFIGDGSMLTNIEQQDLSLSGDTLNLTNDATSVDLGAFINNWIIDDGRDATFGYNNVAIGDSSTAIGYNNIADTTFSSAIGYFNKATGERSSAIGFFNEATGDQSNTVGYNNIANTFSSAFGHSNKATGDFNSAFGFLNEAIGESSSAFGRSNDATEDFSSAFGFFNEATGESSSAFGYANEATGESSSAFGRSNDATGESSSAFGYINDATGDKSNAFGYSNDATGNQSSAFGYINDATGDRSNAFGWANEATGVQSSAFGYGTLSDVYGLMAVGRYNADPVGSIDTWIATDPIFVIGNGISFDNRSTAVTVLKNGKVGIGTTNPDSKLHILQAADGTNNGIRTEATDGTFWNTYIDNLDDYNFAYNSITRAYIEDGAGSFVITSDHSLKTNIEPLASVLEGVLQLEPKWYNYIDNKKGTPKTLGFIAQEVGEYFPEIVRTKGDIKALAYDDFGILAIKAIQELKVEIDAKEELIEAQNEQIQNLEARLSKIEALLSGKVEPNTIKTTITDASLEQNAPNPFSEATTISYFIPENVKSSSLQVLDQNGRIIKTIPIQATGKGQITLQANLLSVGTYSYSLILDGRVMETKQMVLTH